MNLTWRLVSAFILVALFAAGISAYLGNRAAQGNVQRFLRDQGLIEGPSDRRPRGFDPPGSFRGPPPRRERELLLQRLRTSHAQTAVLAVGAALLMGGYLAYRFVRPIRSLTEVNRRYAGGDRSARASIRGHDEIAELGNSFNQLADQLSAEQDRQKQLLADIAHELRTPLTVMRGELEAMQDGLMKADPNNLGRLIEEVDLLTHLVQDLRLLTLADSGGLSLNLGPLDLAGLTQEAMAAFKAKAEIKGVSLQSPLETTSVLADRERLLQVIYNLLENALKHTPSQGTITCTVRPDERWGILEVADSGPGIPPADLPHLFERFYRADPARSRETGGSGLGLAIAKALIEAHGGRISAQNGPQGGALFRVALKLDLPPGR
jgi:two-component system sensor histidine kinase BaeS